MDAQGNLTAVELFAGAGRTSTWHTSWDSGILAAAEWDTPRQYLLSSTKIKAIPY